MRLVLIGLVAGVFSSLFGVGGGIVIVPALVARGWQAHRATATSLAAIGATAVDDSFLLLFNAHRKPVRFAIHLGNLALAWRIEVDTSRADGSPGDDETTAELTVAARSLIVLRAAN